MSNTPTTPTPTASTGNRRAENHRLSPIIVAITVLGLVGVAGAVGATVGAASTRREITTVDLSVPSASDLDVVPVDRTAQRLATAALPPITRPAGPTTTVAGGGLVTLAPRPRPGASTTVAGATTVPAAGATSTLARTSTTRAGATTTRPGVTTTAAVGVTTTAAAGVTTTIPVSTTTVGLVPIGVTASTIPSASTTIPVITEASTVTTVVLEPLPGPSVTTTTLPQRRGSSSPAFKLPGGLVFQPSPGYEVIDKYGNGVTVTNGKALIDVYSGTGYNGTAAEAALYAVQTEVPKRFQNIEYADPQTLRPPKRTILSFSAVQFQGVISGDSGSSPVEGVVYAALRQDGLLLVYVTVWLDGEFDNVSKDLGDMLGSALVNM